MVFGQEIVGTNVLRGVIEIRVLLAVENDNGRAATTFARLLRQVEVLFEQGQIEKIRVVTTAFDQRLRFLRRRSAVQIANKRVALRQNVAKTQNIFGLVIDQQ